MNPTFVNRLLAAGLLGLSLCGCTVNKTSYVSQRSAVPGKTPAEIRVLPKMEKGLQVVGMVNAYLAPLYRNKPAAREELAKETAAGAGADAVVGLMPVQGLYLQPAASVGLLAAAEKIGSPQPPKVVVCLAPVIFKIAATNKQDVLDRYLRQEIQFWAAKRGYYCYEGNLTGAEIEAVRAGRADLQNQARPSGIVPDYVLLCELTGFDEKGVEALMKTKSITATFALYDLRSRGVTWTKSQVGGMGEGLVFLDGLMFSLGSSDDEDLREAISATVQHALQTNPSMPQVPGFERYKGPKQ